MKKRDYLELMNRVLDAYTPEKIDALIEKCRRDGVTEHGFPRLAADLGILICAGFRQEYVPRFLDMMTLCCEGVVREDAAALKTGNEFSVGELVFCIIEAERSGLFPRSVTDEWRKILGGLELKNSYRYIAKEPPVRIGNWAAFAAVSEQARKYAGIGNECHFIENQMASQLLSFDADGFYRDPHEPMLYDLMTRVQIMTCLHFGYSGKDRTVIEDILRRSAEKYLSVQSVTGEIAYGGRSAQYLYNEACLAAAFEYAAGDCADRGEHAEAVRFKKAAQMAVRSLDPWLRSGKLRHVKNKWGQEDTYGCEGYGYFDKYMVTTASNLYRGVLFCRDDIETETDPAKTDKEEASVIRTTDCFHKVFARAGDYFVEYDLCADPNYDGSGLGRIHRRGAPSAICLSVPFARAPKYRIDRENLCGLSLCPVKTDNGEILSAGDPETKWDLLRYRTKNDFCELDLSVTFPDNTVWRESCAVSPEGVTLTLEGEGRLKRALPAFSFDGSTDGSPVIRLEGGVLTVSYDGWVCTYRSDGEIRPTGLTFRNRNGYYKLFTAEENGRLNVTVTVDKK